MGMYIIFHNRIFLFLCACVSGILFAFVWRKYEETVELSVTYNHYAPALHNTGYSRWISNQGYNLKHISEEELSFKDKNSVTNLESTFLYKEVPVLCLIFVKTRKNAKAIHSTWSKHCNIAVFFGTFVDEIIPVLKVPMLGSFKSFCSAFSYVWKKYKESFKWIFIVEGSTFALVENLRYYVAPLNSSHPYYLGNAVKEYYNSYNLGTAGIALSYGAMVLLHSYFPNGKSCASIDYPSWHYDKALGKLFMKLGTSPVDTRDSVSGGRFNPFSMEKMIIPGSISIFSSYWRTSMFLNSEGTNCCSDYAITFHGIDDSKMYLLEYLLYHLSVFRNSLHGLGNHPPPSMQSRRNPRDNMIEGILQGKPYVELIDKEHWKHSRQKSPSVPRNQDKENILSKIWSEWFGS